MDLGIFGQALLRESLRLPQRADAVPETASIWINALAHGPEDAPLSPIGLQTIVDIVVTPGTPNRLRGAPPVMRPGRFALQPETEPGRSQASRPLRTRCSLGDRRLEHTRLLERVHERVPQRVGVP